MRVWISAVIVTGLLASGPAEANPLAPGKPAGVTKAQGLRTKELYLFGLVGLAAVGLGIAMVHGRRSTAISTTGTP
jgi:hypothetical protein